MRGERQTQKAKLWCRAQRGGGERRGRRRRRGRRGAPLYRYHGLLLQLDPAPDHQVDQWDHVGQGRVVFQPVEVSLVPTGERPRPAGMGLQGGAVHKGRGNASRNLLPQVGQDAQAPTVDVGPQQQRDVGRQIESQAAQQVASGRRVEKEMSCTGPAFFLNASTTRGYSRKLNEAR